MYQYIRVGLVIGGLLLLGTGCAQSAQPPVAQPPEESRELREQVINLPMTSTPSPMPISSSSQPSLPPPSVAPSFTFRSPAFASGAVIPGKYSCDGQDINPSLTWSGAPEGTKSFALIVDDPDAIQVVGKVVDHWILWNIPATATSIAEGSVPAGVSQGMGYDAQKYQGPCPPPGTTHRYVFKLYALDIARLDLPSSTSGKFLETVMQGHILEKAKFTGRYTAK